MPVPSLRPLRAPRRFADDAAAASSLVGEVLMMAAFLALATTAALVVTYEAPADARRLDVEVHVRCGDGAWGTGDESIALAHLGGEALRRDSTIFAVIAGNQEWVRSGDLLDGGFEDGALTTGETYTFPVTMAAGLEAHYELVTAGRDGDEHLTRQGVLRDLPCREGLLAAAGSPFDPGFAYEDADGDCLFTEGVDAPLAHADVLDGHHVTGAGRGLVIPPSVGTVTVAVRVEYLATGACMTLATSVVTTDNDILLESGGGVLTLRDMTLDANKHIVIDSDGGRLVVERSTLVSGDAYLQILTAGGDVTLDDVVVDTNKEVLIDTAGGSLTVVAGALTGTSPDASFVATTGGGDIAAAGAQLAYDKKIEVLSGGGDVDLTGATLRSADDDLVVDAQAGGALTAPDASFRAMKNLDLRSDATMDLERATLRSDDGFLVLDKDTNAVTLRIQSAVIEEPSGNDKADVRPDHTQGVVGTPASGGLD